MFHFIYPNSFAIILVEIASRNEPCESEDLDKIDSRWRPSLPDLTDTDGMAEEDQCPCPDEYAKVNINWERYRGG